MSAPGQAAPYQPPAMALRRYLLPRWAKVFRDLWGYKTRSLLVILSIAVGVFAIGTIMGAQSLLGIQYKAAYLSTNPAHATLGMSQFSDALIDSVRGMPEVGEASGRFSVSITSSPLAGHEGAGQWRDLTLYARPDLGELDINQVKPQAGAWPPPEGGIVLERNSMPFLRAQVGDTVQIDLGEGRVRTVAVAGVVHDINLPPAQFVNRMFGYVDWKTLQGWGYPRQYNELLVNVAERADDQAHVEAVSAAVQQKVEDAGYFVGAVRVPEPGESPVQDILDSLFLILGILGVLALVLSGFLVINTIAAILAQQVRQVGVMKIVGANARQIAGVYLGMALLLGLLSLGLAIPLGALAAYALTGYAASFLNFDVVNQGVPTTTLLVQLAVGALLPVVAAAVPVWQGTRIPTREALSSYGLGKGRFGRGPLDHLLVGIVNWFPFITRPLVLSLRNTFRRKGRLAMTMVTLTLGGAIFIAVFSVRTSLFNTLSLANQYNDYDVSLELSRDYRVDQIRQEAFQVPGVAAVETWGSATAVRQRPDGSESDRYRLNAPAHDTTMIRPNMLEGRWLLPDDQSALVVNSNFVKEEPDVQVGSQVTLDVGGKNSEWTVVGVVHSVLSLPTVYANYPYFAELTGTAGRSSFARVSIEPDDAESQQQVAEVLRAHLDDAGFQVSRTEARAVDQESVATQFNILITFLLIMALLIALVGGIGLMGTMSINVLERTREIGVLRAIGASDAALIVIILVEGVLIGMISWVQGALLALPIGKLMSDQVGRAFVGSPLEYGYSVPGALLWLVTAAVIAAVASLLPARNAARLTVREVLSYE